MVGVVGGGVGVVVIGVGFLGRWGLMGVLAYAHNTIGMEDYGVDMIVEGKTLVQPVSLIITVAWWTGNRCCDLKLRFML